MMKSKCCKAETKAVGMDKKTGATKVICTKCGEECYYSIEPNAKNIIGFRVVEK